MVTGMDWVMAASAKPAPTTAAPNVNASVNLRSACCQSKPSFLVVRSTMLVLTDIPPERLDLRMVNIEAP